jgi:replicative DNA helicase
VNLDNFTIPENVSLPASNHAERTILGALMLDSTRMLEVAAILGPDDFYLDSHTRIFDAMLTVAKSGGTFDFVTVAQILTDRKEIESAGGMAYVSSLSDGIPRRPAIDEYIRIVKNKSLCRRLLSFSEAISGRAWSQDESGLEIASWGAQELSQIAEAGETRSDVFNAQEMAEEAEYRLLDAPVKERGISTTIQRLDDITGGIRRGELWIIGASPSRGKTTLARQIVANAVQAGHRRLCSLGRNVQGNVGGHYRLLLPQPAGLEGARQPAE